jgi:hypothetical protein
MTKPTGIIILLPYIFISQKVRGRIAAPSSPPQHMPKHPARSNYYYRIAHLQHERPRPRGDAGASSAPPPPPSLQLILRRGELRYPVASAGGSSGRPSPIAESCLGSFSPVRTFSDLDSLSLSSPLGSGGSRCATRVWKG